MNRRLCRWQFKNTVRSSQDTEKRQHRTNTEDFSEGNQDHQAQQEPELPLPAPAEMSPEPFQKRDKSNGGLHKMGNIFLLNIPSAIPKALLREPLRGARTLTLIPFRLWRLLESPRPAGN